MKSRRLTSRSVEGEMELMNAKPPELPSHITLRKEDWPYWTSIVRARDCTSWTEAELDHAANLARTKADIERIQHELADEGDTVINQRGTPIVNPKHSLLETLTRRSVALSRHLMVHAQATIGDASTHKKRNAKQRDLKSLSDAADDELLASPTH